jgi:threonine/homoserine/homoserine lactone efflux protein
MKTLLVLIGALFGVLAAACAYVIALNEYRQRMLRPDQNARTLALNTAGVTFIFILIASMILAVVLAPGNN